MSAEAVCERLNIDRLVGLTYPLSLPAGEEAEAPFRRVLPQIRGQIQQIEAATGLTFDLIASEPNPDHTHDKLLKAAAGGIIADGTLFVSFGGDGFANQAARLFNDGAAPPETQEAVTFFAACGGACDTARAFVGPSILKNPGKLFSAKRLGTTSMQLMSVELNPYKDGVIDGNPCLVESDTALEAVVSSYFGVGTAAAGAKGLNDFKEWLREHPRLRRIAEGLIVLPPAFESPAFDVLDCNTREVHHDVIERFVGNGQHIAKYGRLPVRHWTPEVAVNTTKSTRKGWHRFPALFANMIRLIGGRLPVDIIDMSQQRSLEWLITVPEAEWAKSGQLWAHINGETHALTRSTHVRFTIGKTMQTVTTHRTAPAAS